jgi:hypothetical protein
MGRVETKLCFLFLVSGGWGMKEGKKPRDFLFFIEHF